MSRGTVSPERSSHRRIVSADECCVVRSRICRDKGPSDISVRRSKEIAGKAGTAVRGNITRWRKIETITVSVTCDSGGMSRDYIEEG